MTTASTAARARAAPITVRKIRARSWGLEVSACTSSGAVASTKAPTARLIPNAVRRRRGDSIPATGIAMVAQPRKSIRLLKVAWAPSKAAGTSLAETRGQAAAISR